MEFFFAKVKIFRFWPKTMDYSQVFFLASPKKVLRKVYHSKGNGKRNLLMLISVAQHLRVGSYERLKLFLYSAFEWADESEDRNLLYAKTKGASVPQKLSYAATVRCYTHAKFHANPLDGYGETVSKHYAHASVCDDLYRACTF